MAESPVYKSADICLDDMANLDDISNSDDMAKRRVEQQSGKQDEARVAIGFEQREAEIGIGDIEPDDLPGQVRGEG